MNGDANPYKHIYTNSYQNPYPPPPIPHRADSTSNDSNRTQGSCLHGDYDATHHRIADERLARGEVTPGQFLSERRMRTRERVPRRPVSYYDSDHSFDSRDSRCSDERDRRRHRSRSRRRDKDGTASARRQTQQKQGHQQSQQKQPEKKTGFAAIEEYITPFNVGILLGCFDLIGGGLSLYMTHKRFGKKAQAAGGGGEPGVGGGSGDKGKDDDHKSASGGGSERSGRESRKSRSRRRCGDDAHVKRGSESPHGGSHDSNDRKFRDMPQRLEYDDRGRPLPRPNRVAHYHSRRR